MATITTLVNFDGDDGVGPGPVFLDADGNLIGTTDGGGANDDGEIFEIAKTADGYASTPTVLFSFAGNDGQYPSELTTDASGDLIGEASTNSDTPQTELFELAKTDDSYSSLLTVIDRLDEDLVTPLIADSADDLFGVAQTSGISGPDEISELSVIEVPKSGDAYASAPTTLASFVFDDFVELSSSPLIEDSAGDLFGIIGEYGSGEAYEVAKTDSGYASTPTVLAPLGQYSNDFDSGSSPLLLDGAGNLFTVNASGSVVEIAKTSTGYSSAPTTLASFDGPGENGLVATGALVMDAAGDLFGTAIGAASTDLFQGYVFEVAKTATGWSSTPVLLGALDTGSLEFNLTADTAGKLIATTDYSSSDVDGSVFEITDSGFQPIAITSAGGSTTTDSLTISGAIIASDSASTVSIFDGSTLMGTATPDANGQWSANIDLSSTLGRQSITAQATTATGQVLTSTPVVYTFYEVETVTPGPGATVDSGDGNVKLFDLSGDDTLQGGSGSEYLRVFQGDNLLEAGTGADTLVGGSGDDTLIGGGHSRLLAGSGNDSLLGGLIAGAHDTLRGGSGDDTLRVMMGSNRLVAGDGHSTLWGGSGEDSMYGAGGQSVVMHGESGAQSLFGGTNAGSTDTMYGGSGPDYMKSNAGNDRMIAGSGDDTMVGGSGDDKFFSGSNPAGLDMIYGGSGDDKIILGFGTPADVYGGSGHDTIRTGMTGDDTITGGSGTAIVRPGETQSDVSSEQYNSAGYLLITFTNDQVLTVKGVTVEFQGGGSVSA